MPKYWSYTITTQVARRGGKGQPGLIQRPEKLQAKEAYVAIQILSAQNLRSDGWRLAGHDAGGHRRGSRNCQIDKLFAPKHASRSDASASGADVHRFRQFDEINAGSIASTDKHGYLQADAREQPPLSETLILGRDLHFHANPETWYG
jgi:hypothetical protein